MPNTACSSGLSLGMCLTGDNLISVTPVEPDEELPSVLLRWRGGSPVLSKGGSPVVSKSGRC